MVVVASGIKAFVMIYGLQFYKIDREYNPLENAIYAATSKWLYVTFTATFVVIHATTGIGKHNFTIYNVRIEK